MSKEQEFLLNAPKTKRGERTLEKITTSAEELFATNGYTDTSVTDITKKADVGAGTFYIYFESKLSLYKYILMRYNTRIRYHIQKRIEHCKTREEMEKEGLRAWLDYVTEHKFVFNITWESFFIDQDLFQNYFRSFSDSYVRGLQESTKKGQLKEMDPAILSYVLMGIANFVGLYWVIFQGEENNDYPVEQVIDILKHGIFPSKK